MYETTDERMSLPERLPEKLQVPSGKRGLSATQEKAIGAIKCLQEVCISSYFLHYKL